MLSIKSYIDSKLSESFKNEITTELLKNNDLCIIHYEPKNSEYDEVIECIETFGFGIDINLLDYALHNIIYEEFNESGYYLFSIDCERLFDYENEISEISYFLDNLIKFFHSNIIEIY